MKLSRTERLKQILALLRINSSIKLNELADRFGVSAETIRRDLESLHGQGLISRTLGGAMSRPPGGDLPFAERLAANITAREALAREASAIVEPGDVVFISSGVTSCELSKHLSAISSDLTVLTSSVRVANAFEGVDTCRIILAPGDFDPVEQSVSGPETRAFIEKFRANKMFFGASGLTEEGPNESRSAIAWNVRSMIERADQVIAMIDRAKFGLKHFERICGMADIDILVTDEHPIGPLGETIGASYRIERLQ